MGKRNRLRRKAILSQCAYCVVAWTAFPFGVWKRLQKEFFHQVVVHVGVYAFVSQILAGPWCGSVRLRLLVSTAAIRPFTRCIAFAAAGYEMPRLSATVAGLLWSFRSITRMDRSRSFKVAFS